MVTGMERTEDMDMDVRKREMLQENSQIDLMQVAKKAGKEIRRQGWLLIVLASLGATLVYFLARQYYRPVYTAYASYIVSGDASYGNSEVYDQKMAMQIGAVFPYILSSDILKELVCERLGTDQMPGSIRASVLDQTNLITVRAAAADPQTAYALLEAVLECYPQVMEPVTGQISMSLMDESGIPQKPDKLPEFMRQAQKGIAGGAVLWTGFLILSLMLRQTIQNREDIQRKVGLRYLGTIPKIRKRKRKRRIKEENGRTLRVTDAGRRLCVRVEPLIKEQNVQVLLVTSAGEGEGKTTAACMLALGLSEKGYQVLLVDADLRKPAVAETLGMEQMQQGTCELLKGMCTMKQVVRNFGNENLSVITGGQIQRHPQHILGDEKLAEIMEKQKAEGGLIILDTPPCGILSDASILAKYADACLFVVRYDYAKAGTIRNGMEEIAEMGTPFLGGILNMAPAK